MEVRSSKQQAPVVAAVLALLLLGAGSLFITWQNVRAQREATFQHMRLAARAVIQGIEASLIRSMRGMRGPHMGMREDPRALFTPMAREMFKDLVAGGEVLFITLYGQGGRLVISSSEHQDDLDFTVPEGVLNTLETQGRFAGAMDFGGREAMVYGIATRPLLRRMWSRHGRADTQPDDKPDFILVGLSAEKHLAAFRKYRRAALIQTGFVLAASLLVWLLLFAYLRRREESGRVERLERFQSRLLDNMHDGLLTLAPDGSVRAANGPAVALLGDASGELAGRDYADLPLPSLDRNKSDTPVQHELDGRHLELLCLPLDGEDEQGERLLLIRDRTRVKDLEKDLAEAERLAEIGALAASVAHEIRNPLGSLRGFAQLFADKLKGNAPLDSYAEAMIQEADRLNRVVTDLLYLAKPRKLSPTLLDAGVQAESVAGLLARDAEAAGAVFEMDIRKPEIYADPDALKQALINLAVNSLHALPGKGGRITIATCAAEGGTMVSVADNGAGMTEEVRSRALEPFFSGREAGTGLGLAMVAQVARAHKGRVEIESEPGRGTRIGILFPDRPESG